MQNKEFFTENINDYYISLSNRFKIESNLGIDINKHYQNRLNKTITKIEEKEGYDIYKILESINQKNGKLIFKYASYLGRYLNNYYDYLFKDKIFSYDYKTLIDLDGKFNNQEEEINYLIDLIEKEKKNYFKNKFDMFGLSIINKIEDFDGEILTHKVEEKVIYFYTIISGLFLMIISTVLKTKNLVKFGEEDRFFMDFMWGLIIIFTVSFVIKSLIKNSRYKSIYQFLFIIYGISFLVLCSSPIFLFPYLIIKFIIKGER